MKIASNGANGELILSLTYGQLSMMINPRNVVNDAIDILPRNIKMLPSPETARNLSPCFKMRMNAFMAEVQKLVEAKAT
jgi:hypothetical protein